MKQTLIFGLVLGWSWAGFGLVGNTENLCNMQYPTFEGGSFIFSSTKLEFLYILVSVTKKLMKIGVRKKINAGLKVYFFGVKIG